MINTNVVPVITPFLPDYSVDLDSFIKHFEFLYKNSIRSFIIGGTTGESISLDDSDRSLLIAKLRAFSSDIKIIGCLFQSDYRSIKNTMKTLKVCDGLLVMPPMFIRQSDQDIMDFYKFVSENTEQDIIVYNNPSRTKIDISNLYINILALPRIVGIKETVFKSTETINVVSKSNICDKSGARIWCGEDQFAPQFMTTGGFGMISALANLLPGIASRICNNTASIKEIAKWGEVLSVINNYPNPLPIKYLLHRFGVLKHDTMRFAIRLHDTRLLDNLVDILKDDH